MSTGEYLAFFCFGGILGLPFGLFVLPKVRWFRRWTDRFLDWGASRRWLP